MIVGFRHLWIIECWGIVFSNHPLDFRGILLLLFYVLQKRSNKVRLIFADRFPKGLEILRMCESCNILQLLYNNQGQIKSTFAAFISFTDTKFCPQPN
jgi:hypothetical protein